MALGAAVQADVLAGGGRSDDVLLLDVVPLSLGLETMGGVVEKLIHRNTTVPCGATQTFTTYADNQTGFDLHVVQGERELVGRLPLAGAVQADGDPAHAGRDGAPRGDLHGRRRRHPARAAREETTGKEASIEVKPSYGLTDEEVERMLLDSFAHAEDDVKARAARRAAGGGRSHRWRRRAPRWPTAPSCSPTRTRSHRRGRCGARATAKAGDGHRAIRAAVEALDARVEGLRRAPHEPRARAGAARQGVAAVEAKVDETAPKCDIASARAGTRRPLAPEGR